MFGCYLTWSWTFWLAWLGRCDLGGFLSCRTGGLPFFSCSLLHAQLDPMMQIGIGRTIDWTLPTTWPVRSFCAFGQSRPGSGGFAYLLPDYLSPSRCPFFSPFERFVGSLSFRGSGRSASLDRTNQSGIGVGRRGRGWCGRPGRGWRGLQAADLLDGATGHSPRRAVDGAKRAGPASGRNGAALAVLPLGWPRWPPADRGWWRAAAIAARRCAVEGRRRAPPGGVTALRGQVAAAVLARASRVGGGRALAGGDRCVVRPPSPSFCVARTCWF